MNWMHGRHVLKFGFDANFVHDELNNLYAANGSYHYDYRDNFIADLYQWQNKTGTESRVTAVTGRLWHVRLRLPYF